MKRTLALGGAVAGMLAYAAVAAPAATAKSAPAPKTLAQTNFAAKQVAAFWLAEKAANLEKATPYGVETILKPTKHKSTVPSGAATTKPGLVGSSGDKKKSTATAKNVNLPRTVGKVFFIGADGKPHWCTGTALQGRYKNLVATAGHCVFDIKRNKATLDKWVFVPGYYKGKTPWGIYVGKTAYTHYDFSVYEDYDRNYAFVTVYNGVQVDVTKEKGGRKLVTKEKVFETYSQARRAAKRGAKIEKVIDYTTKVRRGTPGSTKVENASVAQIAVDPATINTARKTLEDFAKGAGVGSKLYADSTWGVKVEEVSKREFGWTHRDHWNHPSDATKQTAFYFKKDQKGPDKYYKATFWAYFDVDYKVTVKEWEYQKGKVSVALKDVGRLGDNVGGQGLAYNQKLGAQPVFVFGYPSGSHPDGNAHFTGQTLKWSYGKPFAAQATAQRAENLQGIKSAFTGEGALGSAWLLKYSNATRLGYLNGVTIGVADTDGNGRYDTSLSPYFDGETLQVYQAAEKNWSGKIV